MALPARCAQASSLLRQRCLAETRPSVIASRSFSAHTAAARWASPCLRLQQNAPSSWRSQQLRSFSSALRRLASESQAAPSARAYIDSGAIQSNRDLVDVKKVLVIGSGGLSIGQAGEFDYSGMLNALVLRLIISLREMGKHVGKFFQTRLIEFLWRHWARIDS